MIKKYLQERMSWILCFLFSQLLIIFVAFLDTTIPLLPILYSVFLATIAFILFLAFRYHKETRFFLALEQWEHDLDLSKLTIAESPFEKLIEENISSQIEYLKQMTAASKRELEQEKDDLLSWIHEVKTPLTALHLMIERIDDIKLKERMKYEWLRIEQLLDQQLHQRRLPFMENDLYIEETDLKNIIVQEIKGLQSWCMQKRIGFEINLEKIHVLSDAKWLSFIIRQLLTNAVKYSNSSDIHLDSFSTNGTTALKITDCGRGIDPKDLPRIFERGFTSTSHHHDHAATGMGLYLAKNAAQALLISIEVESELGKGTSFTLTFPKKNEFLRLANKVFID
ncbi:sensor histidine kinase [Robertmurraya sp. DFI.2.37]|jgi:OmpR family two-component system bacitracin resistance sensor histidine kinase BceS|uniref:sensor histidine kinase n=1 Tax=Robertmurraya sp. DFI.2.37 TaxID=3031819 RepID=UPI0012483A8C|nr:sensor histidine kinase [Robertmurraya sp. DFI.2.37]MDF1507148.1 sensor histidine kinase [Robertmurraya sp. DFI.2.37]